MAEAVQAFGSLVQGVGGYEAGKFNAKAYNAQATAAEQDGSDEEAAIRARARAAIGDQLVAQGGSGFQMGTGSAADAIMQSQVNAALDALTIRRKAAAQARGLRVQASIAKATGMNALTAGLFGSAGSAAKGVNWAGSTGGSYNGSSAVAAPYAGVDAGTTIDYGAGYQSGIG